MSACGGSCIRTSCGPPMGVPALIPCRIDIHAGEPSAAGSRPGDDGQRRREWPCDHGQRHAASNKGNSGALARNSDGVIALSSRRCRSAWWRRRRKRTAMGGQCALGIPHRDRAGRAARRTIAFRGQSSALAPCRCRPRYPGADGLRAAWRGKGTRARAVPDADRGRPRVGCPGAGARGGARRLRRQTTSARRLA